MKQINSNEEDETCTLASSIIINQCAYFYNEKLRRTKHYKQNLKKNLNALLKDLEIAEKKEYDLLFNAEETASIVLSDSVYNLVDFLTGTKFDEYMELKMCLDAFRQDKKSMLGIAGKILNNKK